MRWHSTCTDPGLISLREVDPNCVACEAAACTTLNPVAGSRGANFFKLERAADKDEMRKVIRDNLRWLISRLRNLLAVYRGRSSQGKAESQIESSWKADSNGSTGT